MIDRPCLRDDMEGDAVVYSRPITDWRNTMLKSPISADDIAKAANAIVNSAVVSTDGLTFEEKTAVLSAAANLLKQVINDLENQKDNVIPFGRRP